ncbi:pancreas transcription factor 1 subunit alpha [Elysia marginata]|uniref:Pancreas transcription factor 1 subunit alpha n=1 Tax=Elysia marginata TaxID=1093978 RepID=A0AAV4GR12_9GAST|nr:pancreas transcription factor 1 subunit alpha [Elysia marginata]
MKKKVYEKQLSQLRPDLTTNLKRETKAKSKSKKSRIVRKESRSDRPKANTSGKIATSSADRDMPSRIAYPQAKVGTLPKVDVLIKRRVVEPRPCISKPSPLVTETALENPTPTSTSLDDVSENPATKTTEEKVYQANALLGRSVPNPVSATISEVGSNEAVMKVSPSLSQSQWLLPASPRYRIDLNSSVDAKNCAADQNAAVGRTILSNVSCSLTDNTSALNMAVKNGNSGTPSTHDSHMYASATTGSGQGVSCMPISQGFPMPGASQPVSLNNSTSAGISSSQPVSLVSSPHMLNVSGQYASEDRVHLSSHPGDYSMSQYQPTSNTMGNELHTLTPMILPDTRRFEDAGTASRVMNYGDVHPVSAGASWEQENNRYSEYTTSWRSHNNEDVYLNNGIPHALKMPFVNGNKISLNTNEADNNNDATLPSHNSRSKLYPHAHQELPENEEKDSDIYANGYTSDESSCAKISTGGSTRRRRKRVQTPVQRSAANMRERRRMCHLNDAFNYLKEHLPNVKDKKKLSRIQTLKAAIYYIHLLRDSLKLQ